MHVENGLERGKISTVSNTHFERFFTQQLSCLQSSLNRVHTLFTQIELKAASPHLQELLHEYLEQLSKEQKRSMQLMTALYLEPYIVRNDIIEGFALELKKLSHIVSENSYARDAGYCLLLNQVIHYLTSFYDGLKELAVVLQWPAAVEILEEGFCLESDLRLLLSSLVTQQMNWLKNPEINEHDI